MRMIQGNSLRDYSRSVRIVVFVLALVCPTLVCLDAHAQEASTSQDQPVHHKFTPGYTAKDGTTNGALRASVHTFKTEDGTPLYQSDEWYKSADDARNALDALTKRSSRVIAQGAKKDAKGGIIGKRVELLFSRGHKASPETVIAWTDGATVVRLRSTSVALLLDFESQFYP